MRISFFEIYKMVLIIIKSENCSYTISGFTWFLALNNTLITFDAKNEQ